MLADHVLVFDGLLRLNTPPVWLATAFAPVITKTRRIMPLAVLPPCVAVTVIAMSGYPLLRRAVENVNVIDETALRRRGTAADHLQVDQQEEGRPARREVTGRELLRPVQRERARRARLPFHAVDVHRGRVIPAARRGRMARRVPGRAVPRVLHE